MKFKDLLKTFLRVLLKNLGEIISGERISSAERDLSLKNLENFSFPGELPLIIGIARKYFPPTEKYPVNPHALLLAIRESERGRPGFEFGVVTAKDTDLATQTEWACKIILKNFERFRESGERDFISFLGKSYAPLGAENDPQGLNRFWADNVRYFYQRYARGEANAL
ncbi:MAG: hypothetical protein ACUVQZ_08175 [Candidatus Caldatribacteriaceae bacterium]